MSGRSYVLQGAKRLRALQARLLQSVYGLQDGLAGVHGPVELMVHVPPEPTTRTHHHKCTWLDKYSISKDL